MRSKLLQQITYGVSVVPQLCTLSSGAATITGVGVAHVDDNGALGLTRSAWVQINAGVSTTNDIVFTVTVQESDVSGSGYTDVTMNGTLPTITTTASAAGSGGFFLKTAGLKKYVLIKLVAAGTASQTAIVDATIILGDGSVESLPRGTVPTVYAKA